MVPLEAGEEAEGLTQPGVEAGEAGSVLVQAPLLAPSHRLHLVQKDYLNYYNQRSTEFFGKIVRFSLYFNLNVF